MATMFQGLAAFPITPFKNEQLDIDAFANIISRLLSAQVDMLCPLGSTGLYPYLSRQELFEVAHKAVELSGNTPVMVGIGSLRTRDVLRNAEAAEKAGVDAVLLAPVAYHRMHDDEVISLYETVCSQISIPLCVYENPTLTGFELSDYVVESLRTLPNIAAIKIPGMPFENDTGIQRLGRLRSLLPDQVAIGVSGDKYGVAGMTQGCDLWFSVVAGLFPNTIKSWIHMINQGNSKDALQASNEWSTLWKLFVKSKGGLRVMATAASILGFAEEANLPLPLQPLPTGDRLMLEAFIQQHQLD